MKIVIDIPKEYYNDICNSQTASNYSVLEALDGIRYGTPLTSGRMTEQEKATKKHREEAIKALNEMRDMMTESDNWKSLVRLIDAVTMGAFAIIRLNKIDYGEAESEVQNER